MVHKMLPLKYIIKLLTKIDISDPEKPSVLSYISLISSIFKLLGMSFNKFLIIVPLPK